MKPDELRASFVAAETSAEEAAIFDTAVAELKRLDERARKAGINPGSFPLDVKQLRGRFINAASPIDSAISFESIVFEIEQLEQRLPPERGKNPPITPRPILLQTHNPEELKRFVETLANERDLYRKKLEEAIAEHSKLKRLLEDLTRDRVANLTQAGQTTKLKQEISLLKSRPIKERQALEQLSNDHEQMRRQALIAQQERDQLKEQAQLLSGENEQFRELVEQLSDKQRQALITQQERDQLKEQTQELSVEIEQFRELITQLSHKQKSVTSKQEKLLDENFTLKGDMFKQAFNQLEIMEARLERLKKTAQSSERR